MNQHQLQFLRVILGAHLTRARSERGASAVEWVVITALLVGIAVAVGAILLGKITGKAESINLD